VNAAATRRAGWGIDSELVVAAAQILEEGVPGDHHVRGPIGWQAAPWSQPALELTVMGFYRVVGVLLEVVPRRRRQSSSARSAEEGRCGHDGAIQMKRMSGAFSSLREPSVVSATAKPWRR